MRDATCDPLTTVEWARIEAAPDMQTAFVTAWRVILEKHGQDLDQMEYVPSTEYVIGESDWAGIGELLMGFETSPIGRSEVLMEWMNRGPSGGKPRHKSSPVKMPRTAHA